MVSSGVISPLIWVIIMVTLLKTPLIPSGASLRGLMVWVVRFCVHGSGGFFKGLGFLRLMKLLGASHSLEIEVSGFFLGLGC